MDKKERKQIIKNNKIRWDLLLMGQFLDEKQMPLSSIGAYKCTKCKNEKIIGFVNDGSLPNKVEYSCNNCLNDVIFKLNSKIYEIGFWENLRLSIKGFFYKIKYFHKDKNFFDKFRYYFSSTIFCEECKKRSIWNNQLNSLIFNDPEPDQFPEKYCVVCGIWKLLENKRVGIGLTNEDIKNDVIPYYEKILGEIKKATSDLDDQKRMLALFSIMRNLYPSKEEPFNEIEKGIKHFGLKHLEYYVFKLLKTDKI